VGKIRRLFARRLRVGIAAIAVCVSMVAASGCIIDGGFITHDGLRFGEWAPTSHGLLVVLYRRSEGQAVGISSVILGVYRNYRNAGEGTTASSILTLRFMRNYCGSGYPGDRCRDATADDEAQDFRDALYDMATTPGDCLAVTIRSGENWTIRVAGDIHCVPN